MSTIGKTIVAIIVIIILIWIGYYLATQPSVDNGPVSGEPIKIGFIGPLTGDAAIYGEPARKMTQLAIAEINAADGAGGQLLEVIYEDGKCTGPAAASAAQKLITIDKVKVIIGGFCSGESLAALPIAEAAKVAMISAGSSSPDLTNSSRFFVRDYPSDAGQGEALARYADSKSWTKVAVIQEQSDYALGNFTAFSGAFAAFGGETVKEEFAPNTTDFRSLLTKLKATNPNALFVDPQTPAAADRILKQVTELKWNVPIMLNDVGAEVTLLTTHKTLLEGAVIAEFGIDPSNPKFQHMVEAYQTEYGGEVPYQSYAQTEYDAPYLVRDAILAVGYDGEKIADWLRTVQNWSGASGLVTIDANGDRVGGHVVKIIKNGQTEVYQATGTTSQ